MPIPAKYLDGNQRQTVIRLLHILPVFQGLAQGFPVHEFYFGAERDSLGEAGDMDMRAAFGNVFAEVYAG